MLRLVWEPSRLAGVVVDNGTSGSGARGWFTRTELSSGGGGWTSSLSENKGPVCEQHINPTLAARFYKTFILESTMYFTFCILHVIF